MYALRKPIAATGILFILVSVPSRSVASQTCRQEARLVTEGGKGVSLFLPDSVRETIRSKFPSLKVPAQSDMKGLWATETEPGSLPYFAKGDFNGDGQQDFALLLANEKEYWMVIFHGAADCSYTIGYQAGGCTDAPLQRVFLRAVPKGEEEVIAENSRQKFATDTVEVTTVERSIALYYWKDAKYQFLDFGGE